MAEWKPKSFQPSSFKEDVAALESFGRGAKQGLTAGFGDELSGLASAAGTGWGRAGRRLLNGQVLPDSLEAEWDAVTDSYRKGRDEVRQSDANAEEANPYAYGAGQLGGAVASSVATGGASALGRAGIRGALTSGAVEGALGGLGGSGADLTHADLDAYARAFRDTSEGGILGAGLGGVGHGVAAGVKWLGGKARSALRGARAELEAGISAEREAADATARAGEEKAARDEAKRAAREARDAARAKSQQQKDFRAANERTQVDKRYADPDAAPPPRAGARPPRAPRASAGPVEDPNTAILGGYRGKAGERRAVNYDRVQQYRQDIADPNFTGDRGRLEQYAREYGDAVDNPGAFERRMVERYLRENYPPEVADRILRERVGPGGEILPRGGAEATQATGARGLAEAMGENPRYLRQRERGLGSQNMGAARYGDETFAYPNADIQRAQTPSGDPFHDAPTKVGLVETVPEAPTFENGVPMRQFEFRDPKSGRVVVIKTHVNPNYPDTVAVDGIGFKDQLERGLSYEEQWGEGANKVGPRVLRDVLGDLARSHPGAESVGGMRVTGISPNRGTNVPLPEVTQAAGPRPWEPEPTQLMDLGDAVRQGRFEEIERLGRAPQRDDLLGRPPVDMTRPPPTPDPFHDAKTQIGLIEMPREQGVRESYYSFEFKDPKSGRVFEVDLDYNPNYPDEIIFNGVKPQGFEGDVAGYREAHALAANSMGPGTMKQLSTELARRFPEARRITGYRVTGANAGHNVDLRLPEVTRRMDLGDAVKQGRGPELRRAGGGGSFLDDYPATEPTWKGLPDQLETTQPMAQAGREPPVSPDDLRQWLDLPEANAADSLPPLEELTRPGVPGRRAPAFAERPQLGPEYQPRPPAPAPVFDPALAERRAMAAQAQAGGGVPTRKLRQPQAARPVPAFDPEASMAAPRDFDAETVVPLGDTQVPRSPRPAPYTGPTAPELGPEPVLANPLRQARPRPLAPPVAPPSQTTMGAPTGSLVRQARQSVGELALQREQGALGAVARAGWEGARSANNALAAPFGAVYGIGKEALQNPAVRARAISLFRLDRLARVRPEVWARVGPTLQRAFQSGPARFKAERHVLLLRDPEFRAAEAEADAELEAADGQPPTRRAAGSR
jgi:hypothetical protein